MSMSVVSVDCRMSSSKEIRRIAMLLAQDPNTISARHRNDVAGYFVRLERASATGSRPRYNF